MLPPEEVKAEVLRHLAVLHPQLQRDPSLIGPENMKVWSWDQHPWTGRAFAWFLPGEQSALHKHVVAPEGRVYFAGEHASLDHTWMQGALASGIRAATQLLSAEATEEARIPVSAQPAELRAHTVGALPRPQHRLRNQHPSSMPHSFSRRTFFPAVPLDPGDP
jgi:hypothetical protein